MKCAVQVVAMLAAYFNDIIVGAVCCREEITEDGLKRLYIMTLGCLPSYQRLGIGTLVYTLCSSSGSFTRVVIDLVNYCQILEKFIFF